MPIRFRPSPTHTHSSLFLNSSRVKNAILSMIPIILQVIFPNFKNQTLHLYLIKYCL